MENTKPIWTPLSGYFKLSKKTYSSTKEDKENMVTIPYSSADGSLIYAMVCTWLDIAHAVGVINRGSCILVVQVAKVRYLIYNVG